MYILCIKPQEILQFQIPMRENMQRYLKGIAPSAEAQKIIDSIKAKKEGNYDSEEVRKLKGNIRRGESYAATRYMGLDDANVHFLDLPFTKPVR